jgi:hypothetical protein
MRPSTPILAGKVDVADVSQRRLGLSHVRLEASPEVDAGVAAEAQGRMIVPTNVPATAFRLGFVRRLWRLRSFEQADRRERDGERTERLAPVVLRRCRRGRADRKHEQQRIAANSAPGRPRHGRGWARENPTALGTRPLPTCSSESSWTDWSLPEPTV